MVNVYQNPRHWGLGHPDIAPSLLQRSHLYDMVVKQEVIAPQHFLIRGLPFPGLVPESLAKDFPYPSIVRAVASGSSGSIPAGAEEETLSSVEMRAAVGLGFNKAAIVAVLLHIWSTSRVRCAQYE